MKTVAILTLLTVCGCGSVDALRSPDAGDGRADTSVPADATTGSCSIDSAGYTLFFDSVTDIVEGGLCQASYSVSKGTNTFNCTCASPALCSQASLKLEAEGQACIQRTGAPPPHDAGADVRTDAPSRGDREVDGRIEPTCVPSSCQACVDGGAVPIPNCGVG